MNQKKTMTQYTLSNFLLEGREESRTLLPLISRKAYRRTDCVTAAMGGNWETQARVSLAYPGSIAKPMFSTTYADSPGSRIGKRHTAECLLFTSPPPPSLKLQGARVRGRITLRSAISLPGNRSRESVTGFLSERINEKFP